jgi:hypothetical protein
LPKDSRVTARRSGSTKVGDQRERKPKAPL